MWPEGSQAAYVVAQSSQGEEAETCPLKGPARSCHSITPTTFHRAEQPQAALAQVNRNGTPLSVNE